MPEPMEELKALEERIDSALSPDVLPYMWGHSTILEELTPVRNTLRSIRKRLGPFVECAMKLADSTKLIDDRGGIVFDGAEAERLMKLGHALKERP